MKLHKQCNDSNCGDLREKAAALLSTQHGCNGGIWSIYSCSSNSKASLHSSWQRNNSICTSHDSFIVDLDLAEYTNISALMKA